MPASAQTFREAVERARTSEPVYLGVKATAEAAQERSKQAFAGLFPQINANANTNANRRDYHTRGGSTPDAIDHYNSNTAQVSLTQAVYRPSNFIALRQAEAAVTQADFQLVAAEQELLSKLITSWFDTMNARDNVLFTTRQVAATRQQWEILRRGAELGTASRPAAEEVRAKHDQARAESMSAEMEYEVRAAALEQIIGAMTTFQPPFLSAAARSEQMPAGSLEDWLERLERSPQVRAGQQALLAANEEVRKQRALYQPTLDLVATYGNNSQQVGNFPGQAGYDIRTGTIGLQLAIPLFSGGAQVAKVAEAISLRDKARHDLEAAHRTGRLATKQAWFGWRAASSRLTASRQAVRASLLTLRLAMAGIASGLKTEVDRLQALVQVETARRDFNKARYDVFSSLARLRAVAGLLVEEDLAMLQRAFVASEADVQELASAY